MSKTTKQAAGAAVEETVLATRPGVELATVPEYLQGSLGTQRGLEDVGQDDVLIPRLCIAQALSPQLKKTSELYIPGLEAGQFFNSVTGEVYGEKVKVIPLFFFRQFIEFKPIDDGGGIVAMYKTADEVPAGGLEWGGAGAKPGAKPRVTEFKNEMAILIKDDQLEPIVVSFKSTGLSTAKKWNSLMRTLRVAGHPVDAFAGTYELAIIAKSKGAQEWFGSSVNFTGLVSEGFYRQASAYFEQLRQSGVKVDIAGLGEEAEVAAEDPTTPF